MGATTWKVDNAIPHHIDGKRDGRLGDRVRRRGLGGRRQGSPDAALVDVGRRSSRAERPQAGSGEGRLHLEGRSCRRRRRRRRNDGAEGDGGRRQSADRLADPGLLRRRLRGSGQTRRHHLARRRKRAGQRSFPRRCRSSPPPNGKWDAVPVNIHSVNWIWLNKAAMEKIGGTQPKTFDDFVALLDKAKKAGIIPLALGGQPWQEATLFELRRRLDRRNRLLQEGVHRPRRERAQVGHDEEGVRQPRQASRLHRPELRRSRLEPRHGDGDQGRRAGAGDGRLGQGRVRQRPSSKRTRTSSAIASPAPTVR